MSKVLQNLDGKSRIPAVLEVQSGRVISIVTAKPGSPRETGWEKARPQKGLWVPGPGQTHTPTLLLGPTSSCAYAPSPASPASVPCAPKCLLIPPPTNFSKLAELFPPSGSWHPPCIPVPLGPPPHSYRLPSSCPPGLTSYAVSLQIQLRVCSFVSYSLPRLILGVSCPHLLSLPVSPS